ncbi:hypothetical protein ACWDTT_10600 [Streptosporangium sandarakinum]
MNHGQYNGDGTPPVDPGALNPPPPQHYQHPYGTWPAATRNQRLADEAHIAQILAYGDDGAPQPDPDGDRAVRFILAVVGIGLVILCILSGIAAAL